MSPVAVAGLLSTIIAFTDAKNCALHLLSSACSAADLVLAVILDKYHWLLFLLTPAMYPVRRSPRPPIPTTVD